MKIAVTATSFCKRQDLKDYAKAQFAGHDLVFADPSHFLSVENLKVFLGEAQAAIIGRERIDHALLEQIPSLKHISKYGVGTDNIDFTACARHKVACFVATGVNADAAAEHTIGLLLSVSRQIANNAALLKQGIWHKDGGYQLAGKTVAVVGCGHIGSRVAKLLTAFGCQVLLVDIQNKTELAQEIGTTLVGYDEAIKRSQIVTFHVPLTNTTREMFGAEQISRMPPGSIVINTSRGHVLVESEVETALQNGQLYGAGLDVFVEEPLSRASLYQQERLVATPHTAGNAYEAVWAMGKAAVDLLAQGLSR